MKQLQHELLKRKGYLENLKKRLEQDMMCLPEGNLRVCNDRGVPSYFYVTQKNDTRGKYIPKKNIQLPQQLAQKDYVQKLYKKACAELADINKYLDRHKENELENVYAGLNEYRKALVTPLVIPDELFVERWEKENYNTNPYYPEQRVYSTKKDELVRSKSEVLLADMYYEMGIPYRYEAELVLKNGKKKYPDFTLLKVSTREVIYHEHLGLLDDDEYRETNLTKLEEYRKNGICLGKNLILTYESEGHYLNIKDIKKQITGIFEGV